MVYHKLKKRATSPFHFVFLKEVIHPIIQYFILFDFTFTDCRTLFGPQPYRIHTIHGEYINIV